MGKIKTLEKYLSEHEFLKEAAEFHFKLEENLSGVEPLNFPPRESVLELVRAEKIPLLKQEKFQVQILDATEKFLRQENFAGLELNEVLTRKIFWAAVDKLIPHELKIWEREEWQENYCPICGRWPVMAQLKKFNDGRARYLLCGGSCAYLSCCRAKSRFLARHDGRLNKCKICRPPSRRVGRRAHC